MDFFKKIYSEKRYGFYVTIALSLLFLIAGIVYTVLFSAFKRDFNILTSVMLFVSFGVSLILILLNQSKYANYVQGLLALLCLIFFINGIYLFASEVMTGIDYNQKEYMPFMICAGIMVVTYLVAMVNCFLPQNKSKEAEVESNE